jgi:hypothetical protein
MWRNSRNSYGDLKPARLLAAIDEARASTLSETFRPRMARLDVEAMVDASPNALHSAASSLGIGARK